MLMRSAFRFAFIALGACAYTGLAVLGWMFFFGGPIVISFLAVVCSAIVVILIVIGKDGESSERAKLS